MHSYELFEPAVLEEWRQLEPQTWKTVVQEILQLFLVSASENIASMRQGLVAMDWPRIQQSAHSLKSASAHVGAVRLAFLLGQIEELAKARDPNPAIDLMLDLQEVYARTLEQIQEFQKGL